MKNKSLLGIFGLAAGVAILGLISYSSGSGQQASVGSVWSNLFNRTTTTATSVTTPTPTVCNDGKPRIWVLSPNGGEVYTAGQQITVKWRSCNISSDQVMTISLHDLYGSGDVVVDKNRNSNVGTVQFPATIGARYGKYYKMSVELSGSYPIIQDLSDNLFTINQSNGVNVAMGTPTIMSTLDNSGKTISVTYTIPLKITSQGQTRYIGMGTQSAATPSATYGLSFGFNDGSAPTVLTNYTNPAPGVSVITTTLASGNTPIEGPYDAYRLDSGITNYFTLMVRLNSSDPTSIVHQLRVALQKIQTYSDNTLSTGQVVQSLTSTGSYRTQFRGINTQ